jgi:hypothetical protein
MCGVEVETQTYIKDYTLKGYIYIYIYIYIKKVKCVP